MSIDPTEQSNLDEGAVQASSRLLPIDQVDFIYLDAEEQLFSSGVSFDLEEPISVRSSAPGVDDTSKATTTEGEGTRLLLDSEPQNLTDVAGDVPVLE